MLEELLASVKEKGLSEAEIVGKVQARYMYFLEKGRFKQFEKFKNLVKVDVAEELVQGAYQIHIGDGAFGNVAELEKITGIKLKLSEEDAQRLYQTLLKKMYFETVGKLKEITGIEPVLSKTACKETFNTILRYEGNPLYQLERCIKETGIKPPETIVQTKLYKKYFDEGNADAVKQIKKITSVELQNPENLQKLYKRWLNDTFIWTIEEFMEITGVQPKFTEEEIHKAGLTCLVSGLTGLSSFKQLQKITKTKIKLSHDEIQEVYCAYLKLGWHDYVEEFKQYTKVKPDPKVYSGIIDFLNTPEELLRV